MKNISFPTTFMNALTIFLAIYQSQSKHSRLLHQHFFLKKKNYGPFYGSSSTVSRIHSHYKQTVLFFTFTSPGVPGTHFINLKRMKAESTLERLSGFQPRTPWLGIQHFNHWATASTPDRKFIGSCPNYMVCQALKPKLPLTKPNDYYRVSEIVFLPM